MDNKHLAFPWLFVRMSFSNVCFPSNFLFCGFFCFYTVLMEVALSYCNAGDPSFIPGSWRSPGEGIGYPLQYCCGSAGKESACNVGDLGSIPGLGKSLEEGKGYPLQYSGLENSMYSIVHGVAKSRTQLSDFHFLYRGISYSLKKNFRPKPTLAYLSAHF